MNYKSIVKQTSNWDGWKYMKKILPLLIALFPLAGCEVTNSTFGTPEKQALVSTGQVGVNYFQTKLNEEIIKNQALERENRELKAAVARSRSVQAPVVARSSEKRPSITIQKLQEKNNKEKEPEPKSSVPIPRE